MKRMLLVGGVLLAVLCSGLGGIWAYHVHEKEKARADLEAAMTRLSDCVLGGPANGDVKERVKLLRISAHATYAPDDTPAAWPKHCASYVQPIASAHRAAYARGVVKIVPNFEAAHDDLADGTLTETVSTLRALADFTSGPHDPSVPAPPPPMSSLLVYDDIKAIGGNAKFGQVSELFVRSQDGVRFAMTDDALRGARSCEYSHAKRSIRCVETPLEAFLLSGEIGSDFAYTKANPLGGITLFDGKSTSLGTFVSVNVIRGRSFKDGRIAIHAQDLNDDQARGVLLVRDRDGNVKRAPFESFGGERFGGGFVLWKERPAFLFNELESPSLAPATEKPATIKARALATGSPTITVGTVGRRTYGEERTDGTCEADHLFFDMSPVLAVRDEKGGWHTLKPDALTSDTVATRTMSCHGDTLTIVDRNEHAVHVQRCSVAAGCKTESVTIDLPKDAMVATVGADALVLWADEGADAIYYVRSPLADLPKAKPKALVDSALSIKKAAPGGLGGFGTNTAMGSEAFSFGDEVVVFVGDTTTYALSIKPDGTASAISATP